MEIVVDYFLDSVVQWVISKGKRYSVIVLVSVNWQKGIILCKLLTFSKAEVVIFSG